ncbi:Tricarboxylate transport protein, mitochondrial [Hondaea fermentalgiana]|uniref:Tricarboxylate transport protein, mitochondrial n=1 Tax=Hondaea fermentalgiana TaxID=2315210 RepID=A0A2R5GLB3_9STRA|nr:Tricarboxylate transport protein, mitochondrial [Hondaea fermentalgiana]|eukprot:GBG29061.1 Tricarboxylate transport protein, mitochondrial [Hondaea fermentalgiana]
MVSTELNTVLRRNASNSAVAARAVQKEVRRGVATVRIPNATREKMIAPMSGFASAAIEITALWPAEYAKTALQLNKDNKDFRILAHIKERGFGIYRGLAPLLIGAPIQGLLRFSTLDYFNRTLADPATGRISLASGLLAGIGAGILESLLVVTPMETVKTQLIHANKGLVEGTKFIVQTQGISGMYKGCGATIAKSASNQALRFVIFNTYKNFMLENPSEQKLTAGQALVGGMLAGALGALGNTPIDTIKSRCQGLDAHRYRNMWHCGVTMVKEEGPLSLYKGLVPRLARTLPGQGIIFCSYEVISSSLRNVMLDDA